MSLKTEKDKIKQLQDKCQSVLNELLRDEDNKYCVDCDSKGPRWASWNIGIFLCIRCAGIHRNLGVHISKVKSVNLDSWTPEQVVSLQQMGNSRARAVYEANLPDNFRRPQNDSSLEPFIRAKYEHKKYIAREWVPPPLPKVNWEKEIDEEMEKQKRKKKTILEKKPLANVEVPQLPKPTNPSPKPARTGKSTTPEVKEKQKPANNGTSNSHSGSRDLLGINGEDSFSGFMSAAAPVVQNLVPNKTEIVGKEDTVDNVQSEEESFFNQTLPAEKEKTKLDKDSILALYGNSPAIPQYQVSQYQAPGGFQPMVPQTFPAFGSFPQSGQMSNYPAQNGIAQGQFLQQQQNGGNAFQNNWNKSHFPETQQNQAQFLPGQLGQQQPSSTNQFPNNPTMANSGQFSGAPFLNGGANANFASFGNSPFFGNQSTTLQQQFGNLTLNGAAAAPSPTPNIWQ